MKSALPKIAITISRQLGCLGQDISELLAQELGFQLVWREIINEAAKLISAPEVALAAIDELGLLGICPSEEACQAYQHAVREVITALAEQGSVVIVGRAGQVILKDRPNVFHVRLIAPLEVRAARISARYHVSYSGALEQVKASDRFRKNYLKRYYQVNWDDPTLYDLIISTAKIDSLTAVGMIRIAINHWRNYLPTISETKNDPAVRIH